MGVVSARNLSGASSSSLAFVTDTATWEVPGKSKSDLDCEGDRFLDNYFNGEQVGDGVSVMSPEFTLEITLSSETYISEMFVLIGWGQD